jgi:heptosyltransferase-2
MTAATSERGRRILVVGPAWVGDMVMAQSLFMYLRQAAPVARLDVLAPAWSVPLLERMPEVSEAIVAPLRHGRLGLMTRWRLGRELAQRNYHQAILLPNSWKSALVPFWAGIPLRTGYLGEQRWGLINDVRRLDRDALVMTVQRFVALARPADAPPPTSSALPRPALRVDPVAGRKSLSALDLHPGPAPAMAICPGAEYGPAKRWPAEYFAEVALDRLQQGWQVWLLGSRDDATATALVSRYCQGRAVDLAGRTNLDQVVDLLAHCRAVVSNDSGLMHVAAALGRPVAAIYGSSDPRTTPPLSERARVLRLDLPCSPCFQRRCPLGHLDCLRRLSPAQVIAAITELDAAA